MHVPNKFDETSRLRKYAYLCWFYVGTVCVYIDLISNGYVVSMHECGDKAISDTYFHQ